MTETRITNPTTGGEKGQKLARFDLVPVGPLRKLAEHFGKGAEKYEDRNWEKGVDWSLSYAALMRHITAWWGGEDVDEEGNSHLAAAMWHCTVLLEYEDTHPEMDDRPSKSFLRKITDLASKWKNAPTIVTSPLCPPDTAYVINTDFVRNLPSTFAWDTPLKATYERDPINDGQTSYGREARAQ